MAKANAREGNVAPPKEPALKNNTPVFAYETTRLAVANAINVGQDNVDEFLWKLRLTHFEVGAR